MELTVELEKPEALAVPGYMTEEEFVAWCDEDVKAEYVDGEVIIHSPAALDHEDLATFLSWLLRLFIDKNMLGKLFGATNAQIRLRPGLRRVPDLIFVSKSRYHLLHKNHIEGAPDLVVEIVSPDSVARDWREKYYEYEQAGVPEYWVIDPDNKRMDIYHLNDQGRYEPLPLQEGVFHSRVLSGFWLKPQWLWQEPLPSVLEVAGELKLI